MKTTVNYNITREDSNQAGQFRGTEFARVTHESPSKGDSYVLVTVPLGAGNVKIKMSPQEAMLLAEQLLSGARNAFSTENV